MEEQPVPAPPETPKPTAPNPVMDVVAPPAQETPSKTTQPAVPAHQKAPSRPKSKPAGVNSAIIATVIIVLGLAALAVYAYLKQK